MRQWLRTALAALAIVAGGARAEERVRVGYFPNLTHAVAIIGLAQGTFARSLGEGVALDTKVFNAGPAEIEALFAGEIDIGYIGPGPAITGFVRSKGKALRVVAGAASGGASLVVRGDAGIAAAKDLAGKKLASPQIGNTQDVALRTYLVAAGLRTSDKGGNVTVLPVANPDILTLFSRKELDGAWVPEPWAAMLRRQAGGKELVDERSLWPDGKFPTTVVIVSTRFLADHRPIVLAWLRGQAEAVRYIGEHPGEAKAAVNRAIGTLTTREIGADVLDDAWQRIRFSNEVSADALAKLAKDAESLGYLPSSDMTDLIDAEPLREASR
jgi:NitT/TauT family transport system substrate-binding protein